MHESGSQVLEIRRPINGTRSNGVSARATTQGELRSAYEATADTENSNVCQEHKSTERVIRKDDRARDAMP